jgi:hypothetical protein
MFIVLCTDKTAGWKDVGVAEEWFCGANPVIP